MGIRVPPCISDDLHYFESAENTAGGAFQDVAHYLYVSAFVKEFGEQYFVILTPRLARLIQEFWGVVWR